MKWIRVTKRQPCTVCGKPDWCTVLPEKGIVNCMRVESNRPSRCSLGGWIHFMPESGHVPIRFVKREEPPTPVIDAPTIMREFAAETSIDELTEFADSLGVSPQALSSLGCQRANRYRSWAFPMFDGFGRMIGIRLRGDDGSKFAVRGSRQGIFLPSVPAQRTAYLAEGASDSAALLTLGLWGFGRPQCCGCLAIILATISRLDIQRLVIIADNDDPGINGAATLIAELQIPSVLYVPFCKDLRKALKLGLTNDILQSAIKHLVWNIPKSQHHESVDN